MSSKRVLAMVDEKSMTNTIKFIQELEKRMGFKIQTLQTDNGAEFVGAHPNSIKTVFEQQLKEMNIHYQKTQPYSPWQNGAVERPHRIDNERFYSRRTFYSVGELKSAHKRYNTRYNNTAIMKHGFKSQNKVIAEYFASQRT